MHVFAADAENADVWDAIDVSELTLVLLAVPSIEDCRNITEQLKTAGYRGPIAAIARYEDEREALLSFGIDKVFNFFTEAGVAFAEDSLRLVEAGETAGVDGKSSVPSQLKQHAQPEKKPVTSLRVLQNAMP